MAWLFTRARAVRSGIISLFDATTGDEIKRPITEKEAGASGTSIQSGVVQHDDYNPDMVGSRAIEIFEKMRRSDGSVRSVLQAIKLPLMRATWGVKVAKEDGGDETDKEIAAFCQKALVSSDYSADPFSTVMKHVLLMFDFGFSVFEKVWIVDEDGRLTLKRFAPRLPQTVRNFEVNPDGSIKNVIQYASKDGKEQELKIPGQYAVVFSHEREGDNYWGISLLRFLYMHWFYKTELYRIDAVRLDRYGVGIPVGKIAKGYVIKPNEKKEIIEILRGLRSHHRAFALLPEEIELKILAPEGSGTAGATGLMDSVDHHDVMMARAVLAHFLTAGSQKHGNYGTTVAWADMFLYGLQATAIYVCDEINRSVIRELCDLNFDMTGREYPKLTASTLEDTNIKEMAAALYNLVLGQVITPDDTTEEHIRKLLGFPVMERDMTRAARRARGEDPLAAVVSPALAAPNVVTGKPSPDDKQAMKKGEPAPGTKPSTSAPPRGPIRTPGDRG
jgi:phage gp29-like protein